MYKKFSAWRRNVKEWLGLLTSPETAEREMYDQSAKDKGMTLSEWIRWHLNRAGRRKRNASGERGNRTHWREAIPSGAYKFPAPPRRGPLSGTERAKKSGDVIRAVT